MLSAQILLRRGKQHCTSRLNIPSAIISSSSSSCQFSTNIRSYETADGNNAPPPPPPPKKKHPQSFVQDDFDLELGELETELPPGYHQQWRKRQRGFPKPRHTADGRDSYWRPPWRSPRAEIISAEDFANRPRVTFSEAFASMHDAMAVLSWMTQEEKNGMYKLYVDMMTSIAAKQENGQKLKGKNKEEGDNDNAENMMDKEWSVLTTNTSHEYVIRVIAQQYNVTTSRAAGVIQLQHNEEQLKKDPTFKVNHALQAHVDAIVRENIRECYQSYRETDPLQFVEEPIAATGAVSREEYGSPTFMGASELTDVEALMKKTRNQEIEEARVRIANHIYVEDVDERTRMVKVDKEAKRLLKMGEEMGNLYEGLEGKVVTEDDDDDTPPAASAEKKEKKKFEMSSTRLKPKKKIKGTRRNRLKSKVPKGKMPSIPEGASPYPDNNRGWNETPETRRPRWKYAAQIINTHMLENPPGSKRHGKTVAKRTKGRRHGRIVEGNTIIEEGGKLRVASVAELEQTSWKNVRNESEFMFKGVKDAWLKRQLEGEVDGWGMQEEVFVKEESESAAAEDDDAEGGEDDGDTSADGEEEEGDAEDKKE